MSEAAPRFLLLDTSGKGGLVALAVGDAIVGQLHLEESRRHARDVVPFTSRLLSEQNWKPRDLAGVIVSLGPGSYTGLRVGLMSAKSLAYATGCAILGVETFAVIAGQVPSEVDRVDVIADAQQERIYLQSFQRSANGMVAMSPLKIFEVAEWLANRDAGVSGPGIEAFLGALGNVPLIEKERRTPTAEGLLQIGLARWLAGERDDVWKLEPIYLRPSAAEEQWQRKL